MLSEEKNPVYETVVSWIPPKSSVLDLGCGSGGLLERLCAAKNVRGTGIEIDANAIYACVERGLSVLHEDIEGGLKDFADNSFDYVTLLDTFQQVRRPSVIIEEALRVGKKVVAGFPNFAHIKSRLKIAFGGRAPVTDSLPYEWHDTPNLHFLSVADFENYLSKKNIRVEKRAFFSGNVRILFMPNLFARETVYLITK